MLDRASSFADAAVVAMLGTDFVPVAVDEWYHVRRKDAEGELYRRIVYQREGMVPNRTTQGLYIAEPDGALVHGWNNRDTKKLADLLRSHRQKGRRQRAEPVSATAPTTVDATFARTPPPGGLVLDVFTRVLAADWQPPGDEWARIFQSATGRDRLWLTQGEVEALLAGRWPATLSTRIARFHLIDNTRGEPPMWRADDLREVHIELEPLGKGRHRISGRAAAATKGGDRGYDLALAGELRVEAGAIVALDLVARGDYRGHGQYTRASAPPGPFTLGVAFVLAAAGPTRLVPPQGARDLRDYLGR